MKGQAAIQVPWPKSHAFCCHVTLDSSARSVNLNVTWAVYKDLPQRMKNCLSLATFLCRTPRNTFMNQFYLKLPNTTSERVHFPNRSFQISLCGRVSPCFCSEIPMNLAFGFCWLVILLQRLDFSGSASRIVHRGSQF
jgi:hypothetical protein